MTDKNADPPRDNNASSYFNAEQLAQIKSIVDKSLDGAIEKAAQTAAQAAVNAFTANIGTPSGTSQTNTSGSVGTGLQDVQITDIPSLAQLQDTLRKETEIPTTSMENSVHELPANLRKEALSGVYGTVEISA